MVHRGALCFLTRVSILDDEGRIFRVSVESLTVSVRARIFLLGVLAYRLYLIVPDLHFAAWTQACIAATVLVVALIYWPIDYVVRGSLIWNTLPYVLIAAGIPFLFKLTSHSMPMLANCPTQSTCATFLLWGWSSGRH